MMSRDPYRSSGGDLGYPSDRRGSIQPQRWDAERFSLERDRARFGGDRFDEPRTGRGSFGGPPRPRERSVDEIYERRGPRGFEDDHFHERERIIYDDEPRYSREPIRKQSVTIEKEREREYFSPTSPQRPARPGFIRRQSSLDTFDRKPFIRPFEREEYGPPARRETFREPAFVPTPLPIRRQLGPPVRRYERDFEEIKVAEPDFYGDDDYRPYPERVREREIIRTRRRSRSRSRSRTIRSSSSSSESSVAQSVRSEFPKRGKTRMPARLVSKQAIIDLNYPFEEEGDTIIILKALGRENIDEVIKLSEEYKTERVEVVDIAGSVVQETVSQEITTIPAHHEEEIVKQTTTTIEHRDVSPGSTYAGPLVVDAGPLVVADHHHHLKDDRAIRAEIKALEAEREALRAEKKASKELRRADRIRREGRESGELILYNDDEVREVREIREIREPSDRVTVIKDKKGRMSISVPRGAKKSLI